MNKENSSCCIWFEVACCPKIHYSLKLAITPGDQVITCIQFSWQPYGSGWVTAFLQEIFELLSLADNSGTSRDLPLGQLNTGSP